MDLQSFKDAFASGIYGMTASEARNKGICIHCKQPPKLYSEAGRREYQISGLCELCFDEITAEE